ncbi:MAG: HAMP domain-containing protein [Chloroflexi bacterium]|nr:MAG: HAMP domain-containing protein [Chloroflexota bacterium]
MSVYRSPNTDYWLFGMMMIKQIRRQLRWKLFFSYLIVVLVGAATLLVVMEFAIPRTFARHMATMGTATGGQHMMSMDNSGMMMDDLFIHFRTAVTEATFIALTTATLIAIGISLFISRRVITPVRDMMHASRQIAQGNYGRRVSTPTNRPITELDEMGQLAHSFNQMAAQLEESDTLRRQLIGDVSHELTTPLTVIKGSMEGLMDGILPADPETYQQVYHEAARLQRLVTDLQELSRVEAGSYDLHIQPIDLGALTNKIANQLRHQFEDKGVQLHLHIPSALLMVEADSDRISQLLINLIGNALQYTPAGERVDVTLQRKDNGIFFSIADTGMGIAPDHLPHLFTRFYRVDKSRARASGGSGIGLTIARHLVEAHNGRIWAESKGLGQGSQFMFWLPLTQTNAHRL